jgi:tripartite-type tricarboxylate transporter receptor subunit TctC
MVRFDRRWLRRVICTLSALAVIMMGCTPRPQGSAPGNTSNAAPKQVSQEEIASYFKDHTVEIVVGNSPGGGKDIQARIVAEFFPRHIPGKPSIQIQNVPGGDGLQATRQVMAAKPDGLTMVIIPAWIYIQTLLGEQIEGFRADSPVILGNYQQEAPQYSLLSVRTELATSWPEVLEKGKAGRVFKYGAPAPGSSQSMAGAWLEMIGAPVKVVYGYGGSNEVLAAQDRKEIDMSGTDPPAETMEASFPRVRKAFPEWLSGEQKFITPVLALRDPVPQAWLDPFGFKTPPHILDAVDATDVQKDAYRLAFAVRAAGDPVAVPEGVPAHIVAALSKALEDTGNDPEFIQAMTQRGFDGGYTTPAQFNDGFAKMKAATPDQLTLLHSMYLGN